jgi:hypothetical protein
MTEINIEQVEQEARAVAQEQSKQGVFNFLDRLTSRNYATEEVEIFLDEAEGKIILDLKEKLLYEKDPEKREVIENDITLHSRKAWESRYLLRLRGISVEEYDAVVDLAAKEYPYEYSESRNPLTAAVEREVIPNEDRDLLFRTHLWSKYFESIEDNNGNVDSNMTPEFVAVFLKLAPVAAQAQIGIAIHKLRMVTNWMEEIQGEDFFPKS